MSFAPDAERRVEALFKDAAADAPGCAVGVVGDGKVLFAQGFGLASLEHRVAITPATRFYLASVSKQVTALAVLLAAEAGHLSLEDSIRVTVPELPAYLDRVTLSHLLTHTGGVRDYFTVGFLAGLGAEHVYTERDVLAIVRRQRALNFAPGEDGLYSNSGYVLLAIAVARATGNRLDDFARETLFGPLGMDGARFQHDHAALVPDKAFSYEPQGGAWRVANCMLDVVGDGGMYASLQDMLAWTANLLAPRIGAAAIELMSTPARLRSGVSIGYGMGLGIGTHRGLRAIEHGGGMAGYRTHLLTYPSEGLGVVILGNSAAGFPGQRARQVAEAYLGERMTPGPAKPRALPVEAMQARAGTYRAATGDVLSLALRDGSLAIEGLPGSLWPLSPTCLALEGDADLIRLDFEPRGRGFDFTQGGAPARRYEPCEAPEGVDTARFLGDYHSPEGGAGCSVTRSGDDLAVSFAGGPATPLRPIAPDCLLAPAFGVTLTFRRSRGGALSGFDLDGGRARGLAYRRIGQRKSATASRPRAARPAY